MFSNVDFKVPNKLENNLLEIYYVQMYFVKMYFVKMYAEKKVVISSHGWYV